MKFNFYHTSIAVLDLDKSIQFYQEALGFTEVRRIAADDGSYIFVFLNCEGSNAQLELAWYKDRKIPWNLGDTDTHLGFRADDFEAAKEHHEKMNCICSVNEKLGVYFIKDPDGYKVEIVPTR